MPTYEYACRSCGHHLEVSQSFSDEPLATCPNCGGPLRKVFGAIGIVLKGSGFYRTDSRAASNGGRGKDTEKKDKDKKDPEKKEASKEASGASGGGSGSSPSAGSDPSSKSTSRETKKGDAPKTAASA